MSLLCRKYPPWISYLLLITLFASLGTSTWLLLQYRKINKPCSDSEDGTTANAVADLPESLDLKGEASLREWLLRDCKGTLDGIKIKNSNDKVLGVNCDFAKIRADQDYGVHSASPLMLHALIVKRGEKGAALMFSALNTRRETDRFILLAEVNGGEDLRVTYRFNITFKDVSLIALRTKIVQIVSISELEKFGKVTQIDGVREISLDLGLGPIPIPDATLLAAAIGDRNGRVSNFVKVFQAASEGANTEQKQ